MQRILIKVTVLYILIVSFLAAGNSKADEKKHYNRSAISDLDIPIVVMVDEDDLNLLIERLPTTTLEMDREGIIKSLAQRLASEGLKPKGEKSREDIAEELYNTHVVPVLAPRVEKFNDLLNREVTNEKVSAGILAFSGIASGISDFSEESTIICLSGIYSYVDGQFNQGQWRISEFSYNGTTNASRSISGKIEEEITFDLKPYGMDQTFTWKFHSSGEVKMQFKYDADLLGPRTIEAEPEIELRFKPKAVVSVEKTISEGVYFKVKGEKNYTKDAEFRHPATFEISMQADEKYWDRTSNKTIYDVILTKKGHKGYFDLVDDLSAVVKVDEDKAKNMLRNLPVTIQTGITYAQAEKIKKILEAAGATVKIK